VVLLDVSLCSVDEELKEDVVELLLVTLCSVLELDEDDNDVDDELLLSELELEVKLINVLELDDKLLLEELELVKLCSVELLLEDDELVKLTSVDELLEDEELVKLTSVDELLEDDELVKLTSVDELLKDVELSDVLLDVTDCSVEDELKDVDELEELLVL